MAKKDFGYDGMSRVLHVNDCAFYAHRVLEEAGRRGLPWSFYPRAVANPAWSGLSGRLRYSGRGVRWLIGLIYRSFSVDLLHIHSGSVVQHTRFARKKYVLTLHGTDIRTLQYEERWKKTILNGLSHAETVMFTTPDLWEHVFPHRPDAIYLPVPVDEDRLPQHESNRAQPRIFFASRWDDAKGADTQLELAKLLVSLGDGRIDLVGLDWGPRAREAAEVGVRLVPKMTHSDYLDFMRKSRIAVGQSSGVLGASELEAMAMGVPLYMALKPGLYASAPPVGAAAAWKLPDVMAREIASDFFDEAARQRCSSEGRAWVKEHHNTSATVDRLCKIYADALK